MNCTCTNRLSFARRSISATAAGGCLDRDDDRGAQARLRVEPLGDLPVVDRRRQRRVQLEVQLARRRRRAGCSMRVRDVVRVEVVRSRSSATSEPARAARRRAGVLAMVHEARVVAAGGPRMPYVSMWSRQRCAQVRIEVLDRVELVVEVAVDQRRARALAAPRQRAARCGVTMDLSFGAAVPWRAWSRMPLPTSSRLPDHERGSASLRLGRDMPRPAGGRTPGVRRADLAPSASGRCGRASAPGSRACTCG